MNNEETTKAVFVVSEEELKRAFMEASHRIIDRDAKRELSPEFMLLTVMTSAELHIEVCKILKEKAENHEDSEH